MRQILALAVLVAASVVALRAQPNLLFQVDISNPAAVVITTTGNASLIDNSAYNTYRGVDLLAFFTAPTSLIGTGTGTLTPAGATQSYDAWYWDNASGTAIDLNFYFNIDQPDAQTQTFTTTAPAFTGTMIADLSSVAALLPAEGATGTVVAGWLGTGSGMGDSTSAPIGQYTVVPEPAVFPLLSALATLLVTLAACTPLLIRRRLRS